MKKNNSVRRSTTRGIAFEKGVIVETATNGFRKCEIFPYNIDIFSSLDFASDEVHYISPVGDPEKSVTTSTATCIA